MAESFDSPTHARTTALYLAQGVVQSRLIERQGASMTSPYSAEQLVDAAKTIEDYILGK